MAQGDNHSSAEAIAVSIEHERTPAQLMRASQSEQSRACQHSAGWRARHPSGVDPGNPASQVSRDGSRQHGPHWASEDKSFQLAAMSRRQARIIAVCVLGFEHA